MPEHLRALIVIIVLTSALFLVSEKSCLAFVNQSEFRRWRNLWFSSTIAAFLSHDFWFYALTLGFLVFVFSSHYQNKAALFFLLLFVAPAGETAVPGFGLVNYLFEINQPRLLALLLLLPCFFSTISMTRGAGKISDWLFLTYLLLEIVLQLRQTTVTDTARYSFYSFLDAALPYYVFSRSLKDIQAFRQALLCLVLACMIISLIALFEFIKDWQLYSSLTSVLGLGLEPGYSVRSGMLRARGPAGYPIALGYLIMVSIGFYVFLMKNINSVLQRRAGMALLMGGLIAALSRGPWLGTIIMIGVFVSTGRTPWRHLMLLGLSGMLGLALLAVIPGGETVINLLPYIGTTEAGNIEYREKLFANALIVIERNFWFGSVDYLESAEMQEMMQGEGIIDIVNSYIRIALSSGIFGLTLFIAFFAFAIGSSLRAMATIALKNSDEYVLGRALVATMIGVLFTIATVSSIVTIPIVYWSLAGMLVGYARMVQGSNLDELRSSKGFHEHQIPANRGRG